MKERPVPRPFATVVFAVTLVIVLNVCAGAQAAPPTSIPIPERDSPNQLTPKERGTGWTLLFDGHSGAGWRGAKSEEFPSRGWSTDNGVLMIREASTFELRAGGDLLSIEQYGDFIFDFEFALSESANSGVKYRARPQTQWGFVHSLGCEYQILDDERHPDAKAGAAGNRKLASLYDLLPTDRDRREEDPFRGVGVWNHGRIHLEEKQIAHYLNGVRVLSVTIDSPPWKTALSESKFADREAFCAGPLGHLVLQDHGNEVRFRNLRILSLDAQDDGS